ncbi:MAG: hypothetical protein WDO74_00245 [Pseudomonadota bacterium]
MTAADGTVATGLVPDQSALPDRSGADRASVRFGSQSEPPTGGSQSSSSRTGKTPHAQTLDRDQLRRASFLPLFAAIGGLAAAASAIFWVTHRPGPAPLITTHLNQASHQAASNSPPRDDSSQWA